MSRVSIKRIELTDFKGQHEKEILLNGTNAIVAGKNGSGKTTLADSWYWTMADKDYLLKNNPDILLWLSETLLNPFLLRFPLLRLNLTVPSFAVPNLLLLFEPYQAAFSWKIQTVL
jgi:hypothetical protein